MRLLNNHRKHCFFIRETSIVPLWAFTISEEMNKPSPKPFSPALMSPRENGWNKDFITASEMGLPELLTRSINFSPSKTPLPEPVVNALLSRLLNNCTIRLLSISTPIVDGHRLLDVNSFYGVIFHFSEQLLNPKAGEGCVNWNDRSDLIKVWNTYSAM